MEGVRSEVPLEKTGQEEDARGLRRDWLVLFLFVSVGLHMF